ncbi:Bgt-51172 [Blumeria graminis f. sp. tritici]|uniref:Bgt-51172 n=1 Tax=Blumeria graminis f. sp. tritici TaxID=62690 RepID=A0A9X9QEC3_BLUGR|nr:Bgt-51172 [Blumeria graminis f. sp. tritici]
MIDKSRLSRLEELVSSQYGRSAVSVLADVDAGRLLYSLGSPLSQGSKNTPIPSRTVPPSRQLTAPQSNNKDRQLGGADREPLHSGMPPVSSKLYPIINGMKPHNPSVDGLLCINCGYLLEMETRSVVDV